MAERKRTRRINLADQRNRKHDPEDFLFTWTRLRPPALDETFFPAGWWERLEGHPQLEEWISELRESETAARKLRLRLEALRSQQVTEPERRCAYCRKPLYARAGAKYCSSVCRAYASRNRNTPTHDWWGQRSNEAQPGAPRELS